MIFRQLFDKTSCTYTYFIADLESREALFIDPVSTKLNDYLALLESLDLNLLYSFESHVHADHISASGLLRQATGAKTGVGLHCGAEMADYQLEGEEVFNLGSNLAIKIIVTPGHTPGSVCFLCNDRVFTGDALLIGGCGRTDFQSGNPGDLYDSVTQKLFTLPGETLVYPGHDYKGNFVSCIFQEKTNNPRFAGKTRAEFVEIMVNLNLPTPKLIDQAVPANLYCGLVEEEAQQMASANEYNNPDKDRRGVQGSINYAKNKVEQVDIETAISLIKEKELVILDVREQNEYQLGHLENSIFLPRGKVKAEVETVLAGVDKESKVLIYCASGNRSALAGYVMQELGYSNVVSLIGGYIGWKRRFKES